MWNKVILFYSLRFVFVLTAYYTFFVATIGPQGGPSPTSPFQLPQSYHFYITCICACIVCIRRFQRSARTASPSPRQCEWWSALHRLLLLECEWRSAPLRLLLFALLGSVFPHACPAAPVVSVETLPFGNNACALMHLPVSRVSAFQSARERCLTRTLAPCPPSGLHIEGRPHVSLLRICAVTGSQRHYSSSSS